MQISEILDVTEYDKFILNLEFPFVKRFEIGVDIIIICRQIQILRSAFATEKANCQHNGSKLRQVLAKQDSHSHSEDSLEQNYSTLYI
ncbi:hypothetical protein TIFTF001_009649 [Ficus carica]|uniref:Uncharacterized protein n=1 Tax=Ficus carica TaxID=3494 RepID=A0AA87ZQA2_FICCA|nr:hypothetical protein TIFTF001_009649 [Ficus carica]